MRRPIFASLGVCMMVTFVTPASADDVVAARTLSRGTILSVDDLHAKPEDLSAFVGMELRRSVRADHPVTIDHVRAPVLVKRNAIVTMVFRVGGLEITMSGRALDDGGAGETIRLMNADSRQQVSGTVREDATVEVVK